MNNAQIWNYSAQAFTRPIRQFVLFALGISTVLAVLAAAPPASAAGSQFFPQTGRAVSGPFMAYWQAHGGLRIFGYPISDAQNDVDTSSGKTVLVQWFERARFELHPEFAGTPYEVEAGDSTPPYPIALRAAHIVAAPSDADTAALLDQANALAQARQCGQ